VKAALPEHIETEIIYYKKIDDGIEVDYGEILKQSATPSPNPE